MSDHTKIYEEKMKKSVSSLEADLITIRAGRANPHVLDRITVDYYGAETPLSQLANINVVEARILQIQPWDAGSLKNIEKALQASDLGINPTTDGKVIRLVFPELTEERRKTLTKDVKKKGDDAKIAVRNIRREALEAMKKQEKKGELTEDDMKDLEKEMQKLTDKYCEDTDKIIDAKNKDIMSI